MRVASVRVAKLKDLTVLAKLTVGMHLPESRRQMLNILQGELEMLCQSARVSIMRGHDSVASIRLFGLVVMAGSEFRHECHDVVALTRPGDRVRSRVGRCGPLTSGLIVTTVPTVVTRRQAICPTRNSLVQIDKVCDTLPEPSCDSAPDNAATARTLPASTLR